MARMLHQTRTVFCKACGESRTVEDGSDLRALRVRAGLPLSEIARRAKVSITTVYHAETNKNAPSAVLRRVYQAILEDLDRTAS